MTTINNQYLKFYNKNNKIIYHYIKRYNELIYYNKYVKYNYPLFIYNIRFLKNTPISEITKKTYILKGVNSNNKIITTAIKLTYKEFKFIQNNFINEKTSKNLPLLLWYIKDKLLENISVN